MRVLLVHLSALVRLNPAGFGLHGALLLLLLVLNLLLGQEVRHHTRLLLALILPPGLLPLPS